MDEWPEDWELWIIENPMTELPDEPSMIPDTLWEQEAPF